jgi:hypothetical protein
LGDGNGDFNVDVMDLYSRRLYFFEYPVYFPTADVNANNALIA